MRLSAYLCSLLLACSGSTLAAPVTEAMEQAITQNLRGVNQAIQIRSITPSPIEGLYEVKIDTGELLFSSADGQHFVVGKLFEVQGQHLVNLSEERLKGARAETLKGLNKDDMIIFSPEGEVKSVVYAFTDTDCGYCQKLHSEMADYNQAGIEIRYLAFPRAGLQSPTYREMVSVWCAEDRKAAMTIAKTGRTVQRNDCDNPIADQYALGVAFGVTGTPALVFTDGTLLPGYMPAAKLTVALQQTQ
ncbi:MAG: thiol:disulfide interchange protein DsbC [Motiliproteus sp.]|jgi:thiol:disulfide interchange protein DsbC